LLLKKFEKNIYSIKISNKPSAYKKGPDNSGPFCFNS
jgi:hypothetical protein